MPFPRLVVMTGLPELEALLTAVERGGAIPGPTPGEPEVVARVRAALQRQRGQQAGVADIEEGLEKLANGLMQLATGQFELTLTPSGKNATMDASFVGLTMLAEELGHSRSEMEAARDEALAANHSKSAFLANMSHELRTPLNAIIGYGELLADELSDTPGNQPYLDDLGRILSAAQHLLGLISDILDLSKIEAGRLEVTLQLVKPASMVRNVCSALQPQAQHTATC